MRSVLLLTWMIVVQETSDIKITVKTAILSHFYVQYIYMFDEIDVRLCIEDVFNVWFDEPLKYVVMYLSATC